MRELIGSKTNTVIQTRKRDADNPALSWENEGSPFECSNEAKREADAIRRTNPELYVRTYTYGMGA